MKKSFSILVSLAIVLMISGCNKPGSSEPASTNAPAPLTPTNADQRPAPPTFSTSKPLNPAPPGSPMNTNRPEGLRFVSPKTSLEIPPTLTVEIPADPVNHKAVLRITPHSTTGMANYRVYQAAESGVYTNIIDAGLNLTVTVHDLVPGQTYYFVATATDTKGTETGFSSELVMKTGK